MNCMKCGRETQNEAVFCPDCLMEMEKYPVQPGTVVLLPRRRENSLVKKLPKRHVLSAEEQIKILRKRITILTVALAVCLVAIAFMIKPTMHYVLDEHVEIGQNYSSVVSTTPPDSSSGTE